jgi:hypothetical protein
MLLLEVYVEHLLTDWTLLDVSAAVPEMRGHLGLWEVFEAVIAAFKGLAVHFYRNNLKIIKSVITTHK